MKVINQDVDKIIYQKEGLSKSINANADSQYIQFTPFDASFSAQIIFDLFDRILEPNSLRKSDIAAFCISQFAYGDKLTIEQH
ncbi:hypothetical protein [Bacillus sp. D386]|uniref:hypothetical protein n=1 Tax=Bacillus sp. D386 TaxID=2587155 RepID=UPI001121F1D0|nr:hypothetical protein [Bacillus sp. D386]